MKARRKKVRLKGSIEDLAKCLMTISEKFSFYFNFLGRHWRDLIRGYKLV